MTAKTQATIEDLYKVPDRGKAEIVDGEIVLVSPTGDMPGRASGAIYMSLRLYESKTNGRAYPDNVGFRVRLPNRESFSLMPLFMWGLDQAENFSKALRHSLLKSEAKTTMAIKRKKRWLENAQNTSRQARR
jgi:hypothetical protein